MPVETSKRMRTNSASGSQARTSEACPRRRSVHPFLSLIAASGLKSQHKSFLRALLKYADWDTGTGVRASVKTLADDMGLSVRAIQGYLSDLGALGVIRFVERSRGGAGKTHLFGISEETLRALARVDAASNNSAVHMPQPRSFYKKTPQSAAENPAESAEDTFKEQFQTSSIPRIRVDPFESAPTLAWDAGGGGGGDSPVRERGIEGVEATGPQSNLDLACSETYDLLRRYEVTPSVARELAHIHTSEEVRVIIEWLRVHGSRIASKAGALVAMLRNGDARARLEEKRRAEMRRRERALMQRRIEAATYLLSRARKLVAPNARGELESKIQTVVQRWPEPEALAASPLLGDQELLDPQGDPVGLIVRLYRAALSERDVPGAVVVPPPSVGGTQ